MTSNRRTESDGGKRCGVKKILRVLILGPLAVGGLLSFWLVSPFVALILWLTNSDTKDGGAFRFMWEWTTELLSYVWTGEEARG